MAAYATSVEQVVLKTDLYNRVWHDLRARAVSQPLLGLVAESLRVRKAELQVRLLREWPERCSLVWAPDMADHDEPMLSIRLDPPVTLPGGGRRSDANHLPLRVAEALLSASELASLLPHADAELPPHVTPTEAD